MTHTLAQLAKLTNSTVHGDKLINIDSVAPLIAATAGQISFVSNSKYIAKLKDTNASAVIIDSKLASNYAGDALINDNPYLTFARVVDILYTEPTPTPSVHKTASIASSAKLHESVIIDPNVVVDEGASIAKNTIIGAGSYIGKGSTIGAGVNIYPNVTLYKDTYVGAGSILHSGAVIGADGFGFAPKSDKSWFKIKQVGNVVIGKEVEIGANTTIDRAALGTTDIADGVKLDNQVHVGHNVQIGKYTVIAAGTVIGGSSVIGKRCQIGGAVALSGHLHIADDVIITGRSMVIKSIKSGGVYSSGVTADKNIIWRKNAARFRHLDEMAKKINQIEKKLDKK